MILIMWVLLATVPIVIGTGVMTIVYGKSKENIGFADRFLIGLLACIGIGEIAHVVGLFGKLSLRKTGYFLLGMVVVAAGITFVCGLYGYFKEKARYSLKLSGGKVPLWLPISFLALVLWQVLYVYCRNPLVTPGDIMVETVQSFVSQDGIYKVMPLTGMASETGTGIPLRYEILCLPTWYAVLSQGFGIDAQLVVNHMVPVVILAAGYFAYFRLSETVFGKKSLETRFWFLIIVALLLTFSEGAVYLDGYGALHAAYLGTSIRNLVLMPYALGAVLERRYWKAVLCILAEACIAWTFWGLGVCVVITLGILFLEILEKKVPKIGKYLQIFRRKEEQV